MPKKRFTDEQIAFAMRQAEAGTSVGEICRKMGVAEATFYRWKKVYAGMGVAEIRRLKQLEDENTKLKRLVADLTLGKTMMSQWNANGPRDIGERIPCEKSGEARPELHVPFHVLPPAGHAEEEPQCDDPGIESRRRDARVGHVQLVRPKLFRRGRVRRVTEERGEILDRPDMRLLRLVAHPEDTHVLYHPLKQRRGSLLLHGSLLSVD